MIREPEICTWVALWSSNRLAKNSDGDWCVSSKCPMSTMLSTSSRLLALITHSAQCISLYSGESSSSRRGISWPSIGGLPSGSFQMNSASFSSAVAQRPTRAFGGTRLQ
ncbi:hypothetical protein D3C85_810240 [compost metagenome]